MIGSALVWHCVRFCRALRERGVQVTAADSVIASRALAFLDIGDRDDIRLGLRASLIRSVDQYPLFDDVFDMMWSADGSVRAAANVSGSTSRTTAPPAPARASRVTLATWMRGEDESRTERVRIRHASDHEATGQQDFSTFGNPESAAFERIARLIARRLALRTSRRWTAATRGTRPDLRRTVRRSVPWGGELVTLAWRRRKVRRTNLVAVCDVSGSMDVYTRFLLQFLHALQRSFARIETFAFSTRLTRTTGALRHASWQHAVTCVARDVTDWSGGTRIGASLAQFVDAWGTLVDRRTVVLILSDGWDTGAPAVLDQAMARLHRRAGRIIWLNPLMASAGFTPATQGMQAALPHIDVLASAHDVQSLAALVKHLAI